jgi:hypothetical protein
LFEFEVVFFGEVPNLARLLNEKKLKDIEAIVAGDLDYDLLHENVETPPNTHTILTLCDKWNLTANNPLGQPVYWNDELALRVGQLTPAVDALYLFDEIMKDAGLQYTSDNLAGCLDNVYVPFVNGQYLNSALGLNDIASQLALTSNVNDIPFTPSNNIYNLYTNYAEYVDEGNDWSGGIYTAPFSGDFTFKIWASGNAYTPDFPSAVVNDVSTFLLIYVNDVWVEQTYFNTTSGTGNTPFNNITTQTVTLNTGDTLKIKFQAISGGTSINTFEIDFTGNGIGDYTGTGIELVSVGTSLIGDTVVMRANAPDMKQIDFITSIQKMFNLVFVAEDRKSVV